MVIALKHDTFHVAKKDVRKAKNVLDFAIPVYKSEREEADDDWDVEKQFVKGLSEERGWCWKRNM